MKIPAIVILVIIIFTPEMQAAPYEVLVVDTAGAGDRTKIEEFKKDATQFNALHRKGY